MGKPTEIQDIIDFKVDQGKYHTKNVWNHTLQVVEQTPDILEVRWAALFHDSGKPETWSVSVDGDIHFYGHDKKGEAIWNIVADRLKTGNKINHYYKP